MTCPPCNHNCNEGRDCPARTNLIKTLWQRYLSNITLVRFTAWPLFLLPPVMIYYILGYFALIPTGFWWFIAIVVFYMCVMLLAFGD